MKHKKKIIEEINSSIPDIKNFIKSQIAWQKIKEKNKFLKKKKISQKGFFDQEDCALQSISTTNDNSSASQKASVLPVRKNKRFKLIHSLAAICLVLLVGLGVFLPITLSNNNQTSPTYFVTYEINPSIRLEANKQDIVIKQQGLNKDGIVFLYRENLLGKNIYEASQKIFNDLKLDGFLNSHKVVKIGVRDAKGQGYEKKQNEISLALQQIFSGTDNVSIADLNDDDLDAMEDYYEQNNLSEYEKELVYNFRTKLIQLTNQKILDINNLINFITPFASENEEFIENFTPFSEVESFCKKYNLKLSFNLQQPTGEDILEFLEELTDDAEELVEILQELNAGVDEDEFADLIEDLLELAKELLYEEN